MGEAAAGHNDWTVGQLLSWTTDYLKRQGADSPRLDAEVLLAEARGCQRIELYTDFDQLVDPQIRAVFRQFVQRRATGVPVAHLVGRREFYSLSFAVTTDVLIPRPETELLVVALLDAVKERPSETGAGGQLQIADVGTGSGVLAICAAKHVPQSRVVAVDISPAALAVAAQNASAHQFADRIELIQGDLLEPLPADRTFDYILSNPPYVRNSELQNLAPDVRDYEPHLALVSGPRGTEVIQRLIPQAAGRLRDGGALILEISPLIEAQVLGLFASENRFAPPHVIKDMAGLPRVCVAAKTTP